MRNSFGRPAALVAVAVLVASCASSPAAIFAMSGEEIAAVSDTALCRAYATARRDQQTHPAVDEAVGVRGLSCDLELAQMISDCSVLEVLSTETVDRGIIVSVRNNGPMPRQFRVAVNGIASSLQRVEPRETHRFGIEASMPLRAAGAGIAMHQQNLGVQLGECTVPYY